MRMFCHLLMWHLQLHLIVDSALCCSTSQAAALVVGITTALDDLLLACFWMFRYR
jgi:hypothetical protein